MANDEILFRVSADLSELKPQFDDLSEFWKQHNIDVKAGEKAIDDYSRKTAQSYKKVNDTVKQNVNITGNQAKAIQDVEKRVEALNKKNKDTFDSKKLQDFNKIVNQISRDLGNIEPINLTLDDFDELTEKLSSAKDEFETLNILVEFFDRKLTESADSAVDSFDIIKRKIDETKLNIRSTEDFIKDISKQIDDTAPGTVQAGLIQERESAKRALIEEQVALEDYKQQLKEVGSETVTLRTRLRNMKEELVQLELQGQKDSERYRQLREDAELYNDALQRTNRELNRSASQTQGLDNLIGAVSGVVGVYSTAQGAQALFGEESEDLFQILVKLNGAIAILSGLQAVQAEVTKRETLAGKAYNIVQREWATLTDNTAKATTRLKSALNLLGIGLVISSISFLLTNYKEIAKFVGIISEESERLNVVNKKANELYGEQIANLKILTQRVKEGELSITEKADAVNKYNEELGDTFNTVKTYAELERALIDQGDDYIEYLALKARAEGAYQLAVEKTKEALEKRSSTETSLIDFIPSIGRPTSPQTNAEIRNRREASELEEESDALLKIFEDTFSEASKLADKLGLSLVNPRKNLADDTKKIASLFEDLINRQKALRTALIENDRERERQVLIDRFDEERDAYAKQIEDLKATEEEKRRLRFEFNKLYNEETGLAYEQLRARLLEIDRNYAEQLEEVQFTALQAIDKVVTNGEEAERQSIIDRWDKIREEIERQIKLTDDQFKKEGLQAILGEIDQAEETELGQFDLSSNLERVNREEELAQSILEIYQRNTRDILNNAELEKLQLLELERDYLQQRIKAYEGSLDPAQQGVFNSLIEELQNTVDPNEIESIGDQLRRAFGDETAQEILKIVQSLNEVNDSIDDTTSNMQTNFERVIDDISRWTSSLESFALSLAETLGLQGQEAQEFAQGLTTAIQSTVSSITFLLDAEIDQRQRRIREIEDAIDGVEQEIERERDLYEQGYANNLEAREADLQSLKDQKRQEQEELRKAQQTRAKIAKAEFAIDTISQLNNLITASSSIFKWASKIPIIGTGLAIGLIATMFTAFAAAKVKAFQLIGQTTGGQSFRQGLREGKLSLSGPSHGQGGFGLFNSRTGERIAEFEDGEDVYVLNRDQKRKYANIMDALIRDAQGYGSIDSTLEGYYGNKGISQAIKRINKMSRSSSEARALRGGTDEKILKEITSLTEKFSNEFEGYKKERDGNIQFWETPNFYHIKKGQTVKRYPK